MSMGEFPQQQPRRRPQHNNNMARKGRPAATPGLQGPTRPYYAARRPPQAYEQSWKGDWDEMPSPDETLVHFHKSFGVMQEIFDHRDFTTLCSELHKCTADHTPLGMMPSPSFLDLGCAPGGFSACLLQDNFLGPNSVGYGVSLPPHLGGFQMLNVSDRLAVQLADMLQLSRSDLICADNSVDLCLADAQYLSCLFKNGQGPAERQAQYRGVKAQKKTLGIWCLTVKECALAFAKLRHGGGFIFRFGWRGIAGENNVDVHPSGEKVAPDLLARYLQEEEWYKALTHWLFAILKSLFTTLRPFKSEYVHQADVSFYMVCRGFDRTKYETHAWEAKLTRAFDELGGTDDEAGIIEELKNSISPEIRAEIDALLELVGRMRAIGINSRKVTNPAAYQKKFPDPPEQLKVEKPQQLPKEDAAGAAEKRNGMKKDREEKPTEKEGSDEGAVACTGATLPSGSVPALSDASTVAESGSAKSSSSMPQASDASNVTASEVAGLAASKAQAKAKTKSVKAKAKSGEDPFDSSASKRGAQSLGGTHVCSASSSGKSFGGTGQPGSSGGSAMPNAGGQGRGMGMRKPPWAGAPPPPSGGPQWANRMPYTYGYDGAPAPVDQWGGHSYYSMPEQAAGMASGVDSASMAALEAEEVYRQQMHFNMFQSNLSAQQRETAHAQAQHAQQDGAQAMALQVGGYQAQHQWPSDQLAQNGNFHHMPHSMGQSHASHWQGDMLSNAVDYHPQQGGWMSQPGVSRGEGFMLPNSEECMMTGARSEAQVVRDSEEPQQNHWQQPSNMWSGDAYPGHDPGIVLQADLSTPAAGSSSLALDAAAVPLAQEALAAPPSAVGPLTEVWPGLLAQRRKPGETAAPETNVDLPDAEERSRRSRNYSRDGREEDKDQNDDSESFSSDEDGQGGSSGRRGHRHKRRAGRMVRERRSGRRKRNGFLVSRSLGDRDGESLLLKLKAIFFEVVETLPHSDLFIQCMRFGLFCAMAWSTNSIIFSMMQLYKGELLPTEEELAQRGNSSS